MHSIANPMLRSKEATPKASAFSIDKIKTEVNLLDELFAFGACRFSKGKRRFTAMLILPV